MSGRKPAFDPSRLENDLDELLPAPPPSKSATSTPLVPPVNNAKPNGASTDAPPRSPRGAPGRPPGSTTGASAPAVTAVRIPKPLYDAVIHDLLGTSIERPSYAQVVAWTCEDYGAEVVIELTSALQRADREPRGRRLASDGVPLTLRFQLEERGALDDVIRRAGGPGGKVTRTAGVTAALRVAVKYGITATATSTTSASGARAISATRDDAGNRWPPRAAGGLTVGTAPASSSAGG